MPLSEQEQRLLDEMERHLMNGDADVVSTSAGGRTLSYRNLVIGAVLVIAGIATLISGVAIGDFAGTLVGVAGFAFMFSGVVFALTPVRAADVDKTGAAKKKNSSASSKSFTDRMNDRWDKRQEGR